MENVKNVKKERKKKTPKRLLLSFDEAIQKFVKLLLLFCSSL